MAELIVYDEPERNESLNVEALAERFGIKGDQPPAPDQPYDPHPLRKGDHVTIRLRLECQGYDAEQHNCSGYTGEDKHIEHHRPDGTEGVVVSVTTSGYYPEWFAKLNGHVYIVLSVNERGWKIPSRHTRSELDRR